MLVVNGSSQIYMQSLHIYVRWFLHVNFSHFMHFTELLLSVFGHRWHLPLSLLPTELSLDVVGTEDAEGVRILSAASLAAFPLGRWPRLCISSWTSDSPSVSRKSLLFCRLFGFQSGYVAMNNTYELYADMSIILENTTTGLRFDFLLTV